MIRLKEILKDKGLTMVQLAELSGITPSNLSNYTNGKVSPTLETLNKIADALNIDITELFKPKEDVSLYAEYDGTTYKINKEDIITLIKNKQI
ncbi:helix-turn-helix transcriptional regulator [Hoylesella nanceiensis]|jgi:hypothetical protein|uniref:helix-turn-helix domain-containing protein n=1 Tax=Hoylesella nanceiensis TaxID=425941 RepID=UPI0028E56D43|nr:helix-turn-helix transcriptional regulator [Hoylesella nanceiensis]